MVGVVGVVFALPVLPYTYTVPIMCGAIISCTPTLSGGASLSVSLFGFGGWTANGDYHFGNAPAYVTVNLTRLP
jgi:hypothetical protein